MHDTNSEAEKLWRTSIMSRSSQERLTMGLSMYETAQKIVLASLDAIQDPIEKKIQLFRRFYSRDFSEKEMTLIVKWMMLAK